VPSAKKKLFILGAGDYAREYLWVTSEVPESKRTWVIAGCLDDNVDGARERFRRHGVAVPVVGTIRDHTPKDDEVFICSIAQPRAKLQVCEALSARGATFVNLFHPTACIAPDARVGVGVFLFRYVSVSVGAVVGNHVAANMYASIGHDAKIGDGCTINSHCDITGHATLGRGAFLGSHALVLPKSRVGTFSLVGAGSVVLRSVADGASVIGVPARRL
jgi:sugar O-acyltransferase (sialic acid O-acetyltransferase NeuD family)